MIPAAGWALVSSCLIVSGPDCTGYMATGLVWNDEAHCVAEQRRENIPGAQCMKIVGVQEPVDTPVVPGMDEVVRMLDEEASNGRIAK